ncbi:MAG: PEGA domain-containing protein [Spirochaetales bacterium]|nr:PEGA domain-containing protein [Spirochaetales bacterium]
MKRNKIVIILMMAALLLPGMLFAQRATGGRRSSNVELTVQCNVRGANVEVTPQESKDTQRGSAPATFTVAKGAYTITVSANGYDTATQSVNLTAAQTVNITLQPTEFALRVTSNVPTALVQIKAPNGSNVGTGRVALTENLRPATYEITVSADGYNTATRSVSLSRNQTINVDLTPAMGTVNIVIPAAFLDVRNGNPSDQVEVYVDGQKQSSNRSVQMRPGRHTIRVSSGGFNIQQIVNIAAGDSRTLELFMELQLK